MIGFPDTNVLFKLAGFDLLREALTVLSVAPQDLFILQETRRMCLGTKMKAEYGRQAVARVESLVRAASVRPGSIDPGELAALTDTDGIDEGEAVLFAATRGYTEFIIISDDKNSLRALAEEPACQITFDRICGHVICLEDLLLRVMAQHDYEQMRRKLLLAHYCVAALSQTLGRDQQAPQLQVESALQAAVDRLRPETNYILAPLRSP